MRGTCEDFERAVAAVVSGGPRMSIQQCSYGVHESLYKHGLSCRLWLGSRILYGATGKPHVPACPVHPDDYRIHGSLKYEPGTQIIIGRPRLYHRHHP